MASRLPDPVAAPPTDRRRLIKGVLIATALLAVSFVLAMALVYEWLPTAVGALAALYVQLTLPPTTPFVFAIVGAIVGRRGWLAGAIVGLIDGVLWNLLFVLSPAANLDGRVGSPMSAGPSIAELVTVTAIAVVVGTVVAGIVGLGSHWWTRWRSGRARTIPAFDPFAIPTAPMPPRCPQCGVPAAPIASYCSSCGTRLA